MEKIPLIGLFAIDVFYRNLLKKLSSLKLSVEY